MHVHVCIWVKGGTEGEEETETLKPTVHWVQNPSWGSIPWLWDHDLTQNQEWDAWPIELPRRYQIGNMFKQNVKL